MNWFRGFSTCSPLGVDGCVIWWEAWAVVFAVVAIVVAFGAAWVAFLGVLGSWAAAAATYLAVVKPLERRKLEERIASETAMESFAAELIQLRYDLGMRFLSLSWLNPSDPEGSRRSVKSWVVRGLTVPSPVPAPENVELVKLLNKLRGSLKAWNQRASSFDISPDEHLPSDFPERAIEALTDALSKVQNDIRQLARVMKEYAPAYANELQWIAESGDGFIPYFRAAGEK